VPKKAPGVPLYKSLENQLEAPLSTFLGPDMPSRPPETVVDVVEQTLNRKQPMSKIKATRVKIKKIMDADEIVCFMVLYALLFNLLFVKFSSVIWETDLFYLYSRTN